MNSAPIGVFDSGLGGLTVLKEIIAHLPGENTIYLGDTARVPYGIRSPEVIIRYSFENTRFLLSKGIKLLVIACNTASAISLESLRRELDIPVLGVIEPGARAAVKATRSGRIGVIGTETTIKSGAYERVIKGLAPEARVVSRACPLFVPLAEEGWTENEVAQLAAKKYLDPLVEGGVDTLVLGCTHYPLLKNTVRHVMGEDVALIDSGTETAMEIKRTLHERGLSNGPAERPKREFFSTDSPEKFGTLGRRFFGDGADYMDEVELVEVWDEARWQKK